MLAHSSYRFRRYWPVTLILLAGLAVSAGLGWRLYRQAVEVDRERLGRIGNTVREALLLRMQTTDLYLRDGEDYFGSQERITWPMFREWCMKYGWSINTPWLHGVAFYTNSNAGVWRRTIPPDPTRWTPADFKKFSDLALETPIELASGYEYCSDRSKSWPTNYTGKQHFAWRKSSPQGEPYTEILECAAPNSPCVTTRHRVINRVDGKTEYGATIAVPVYGPEHDALLDLIEPGRKPGPTGPNVFLMNWNLCRGVLVAPIDFVNLESTIWDAATKEVGVEIFSSDKPNADQWLNAADYPPRALAPAFKCYLKLYIPWKVYNRKWTLFLYTLPPFDAGSSRSMAYVSFAAGSGLSLLSAALVGVALRARNRQEEMTAEVVEARDALAAAEKERERLGHDLHDGAIQSLYAVLLKLGRAEQTLDGKPDGVRQVLSAARVDLDRVIAEIRRFILVEEPSDKAVDLSAVLRAMTQRDTAAGAPPIELHCDPAASESLSASQAIQVANIAREALSNALRHANAHQVKLMLARDADAIRLEIVDDGVGFNSQELKGQTIGLTSMAARSRDLGAKLEIDSAPGRGTRVVVRIPVTQQRGGDGPSPLADNRTRTGGEPSDEPSPPRL